MEPDPKNVVGSVIKAAGLLELFTAQRREVTLAEFTRETGCTKTTAHRLLQTLVGVGWLVRSAAGGYRLGSSLLVLGAIARLDLDVRTEALPYLHRLAGEFGESAFLLVPGQHGAVTIEAVDGPATLGLHGPSVGSVLPYHAGAGPIVLAAFSPHLQDAVLTGERQRFTARTATSRAEVRALFADARTNGYAVSSGDHSDDVAALAAPVLGADGTALAALSVAGRLARFGADTRDAMLARVVEYADELSARMTLFGAHQ